MAGAVSRLPWTLQPHPSNPPHPSRSQAARPDAHMPGRVYRKAPRTWTRSSAARGSLRRPPVAGRGRGAGRGAQRSVPAGLPPEGLFAGDPPPPMSSRLDLPELRRAWAQWCRTRGYCCGRVPSWAWVDTLPRSGAPVRLCIECRAPGGDTAAAAAAARRLGSAVVARAERPAGTGVVYVRVHAPHVTVFVTVPCRARAHAVFRELDGVSWGQHRVGVQVASRVAAVARQAHTRSSVAVRARRLARRQACAAARRASMQPEARATRPVQQDHDTDPAVSDAQWLSWLRGRRIQLRLSGGRRPFRLAELATLRVRRRALAPPGAKVGQPTAWFAAPPAPAPKAPPRPAASAPKAPHPPGLIYTGPGRWRNTALDYRGDAAGLRHGTSFRFGLAPPAPAPAPEPATPPARRPRAHHGRRRQAPAREHAVRPGQGRPAAAKAPARPAIEVAEAPPWDATLALP